MGGVSILPGATVRGVEGRRKSHIVARILALRPEIDAEGGRKGERSSGTMDSNDCSLNAIYINLFLAPAQNLQIASRILTFSPALLLYSD